MKVVKGTLTWEASDGTNLSLGFVLPFEVAENIAVKIIGWKEKYMVFPKEYDEYLEKEKEFLSKPKENVSHEKGG
jgi:hypothetical protein